MMWPSAPLTLLTNTSGVPGVPALRGIFTTVSFPVLATNKAVRFLLKARPLAPNGGTPVVVRSALVTHAVGAPPAEPVRQMMPWNESEM